MKTIFRNTTLVFTLFLALSCGGVSTNQPASTDDYIQLMVLPAELSAVDANLSGTLYIYRTINNTTTLITAQTVIFEVNSDGEDIAVSPPATLSTSTTYRFVLVYAISNVEVAHVDKTVETSNDATTNLTYDAADLVTSNNSIEEILAQSSISAGIIPNLDLDDDGYSNLEEIIADSDPEDPDSTP